MVVNPVEVTIKMVARFIKIGLNVGEWTVCGKEKKKKERDLAHLNVLAAVVVILPNKRTTLHM